MAVETLSVELSYDDTQSAYRDSILHKYGICVSHFGLLVAIDMIWFDTFAQYLPVAVLRYIVHTLHMTGYG